MVSYSVALGILRHEGRKRLLPSLLLQTENLVRETGGEWVLAADLRAGESLPEFDNSAVDGYAVRSLDLKPGRQRLPVTGRSLPGETPREGIPGGAVEIMTGGPMPEGGFDTLVMVEAVEKCLDVAAGPAIEFDAGRATKAHLRPRGSDYRAGDLLASAGTRIGSRSLLSFAALGVRELPVFRRPRVFLLSTGDELVPAFSGERPAGRIRNCTAPFLEREFRALGCEVRGAFAVADGPEGLEGVLRGALLEGADLIVSTGAVSMGVHDRVKEGVLGAGGRIGFHKVAIRPGKPLLFADFPEHPGALFLGLPGNPVSSVVGFEFFIQPLLRAMRGQEEPGTFPAVLAGSCKKPSGMRCFFRARWSVGAGRESRVELLPAQGSHVLSSFGKANAWAILPEEAEELPAGSPVEVAWCSGGTGGWNG